MARHMSRAVRRGVYRMRRSCRAVARVLTLRTRVFDGTGGNRTDNGSMALFFFLLLPPQHGAAARRVARGNAYVRDAACGASRTAQRLLRSAATLPRHMKRCGRRSALQRRRCRCCAARGARPAGDARPPSTVAARMRVNAILPCERRIRAYAAAAIRRRSRHAALLHNNGAMPGANNNGAGTINDNNIGSATNNNSHRNNIGGGQ